MMNSIDKVSKNGEEVESLTLTGAKNDLAIARSFVSKILDRTNFKSREQHLLILAVDEAYPQHLRGACYVC